MIWSRVLPELLKILESNTNGGHSIDSMCLHGFDGSERGGHCPYFRLVGGGGKYMPLVPPASATYGLGSYIP